MKKLYKLLLVLSYFQSGHPVDHMSFKPNRLRNTFLTSHQVREYKGLQSRVILIISYVLLSKMNGN